MSQNESGDRIIDHGSVSGSRAQRGFHPEGGTMKGQRILYATILLIFFASLFGSKPAVQAQASNQGTNPETVLFSMSPEERVGQLFLVTFTGTDTSSESEIYDLITNHHIGGVVLQAGNDNFVAVPDTVPNVYQLISSLQSIEWNFTADAQAPLHKVYVPLFVGISQEGDGVPNDQILNGLTPLPDAMAIGATWKPDLAKQVGAVLGNELSALGFNLLLGPSLDVSESPDPAALSDLGTRVFGGDPFWVGEMGRAFVSGLHQGSNNRMVVVAKHFPGRGSSDRLPEEEVATVRKSLEQLKQIELPPFFAVTNSSDPAELVDGLLVSHIRYQGFQGNIRATTRPVSFDATALPAILALPQFTTWRSGGGLIVSDSLGSAAVRDFYLQQGAGTFSPRLAARDAFLAGNDLLYLGNIQSDAEQGTYNATLEILDYFAQEYRNDPVFAQRVDAAVLRILTRKARIYPTFNLTTVQISELRLDQIGVSQPLMSNVARDAATLIAPDTQELSTLLPSPPGRNDSIVFLTDTMTQQQCSSCPARDAFAVDAMQKNVVRLFGQTGSAQIQANRLSSFPLTELEAMLNGEATTEIENSISHATWIVISIADVNHDQRTVLRRFFTERPNLIRNKNVILFSFTAPYYLDATDISKLDAYYVLYSKQPAFIDVAARLLFQQVPVLGSSPVSIPAVGYDLITETSPDPKQVIPLSLDTNASTTPTVESSTPVPTLTPNYRIGDTIAVRAGPILDSNGHIVPDGTVARFTMSTRDDTSGILRQVEANTSQGVARANFVIDKPGNVEIVVTSEPALVSVKLQFVASNEGVTVTEVPPVVTPTATLMLPTLTPVATPIWVTLDGYPRMGGWLLALLALFGSVGLAFWAVSKIDSVRWGLRWALCMSIGGLIGYNYLALGFPGAAQWIATDAGVNGMLILMFSGETVGGIAALIWMRRTTASTSQVN